MPDSHDRRSGVDRALEGLDAFGRAVSTDSRTAHDDSSRTGDQISSGADSVMHGIEQAAEGIQQADDGYRRMTGHDSSLLEGAEGLVTGVQHAAQPVAEFAHELGQDAHDVSNVADSVGQVGSDVSTDAHDGQTTVNDARSADAAFSALGHGHLSIHNLVAAKDAAVALVNDVKRLVGDAKKTEQDVEKVGTATKTAYNNIVDRHSGHHADTHTPASTGSTPASARSTPAAEHPTPPAEPEPAVTPAAFQMEFHSAIFDDPDSELGTGDLFVLDVHGQETVSQTYEYVITLAMRHGEHLDFDTIDDLLTNSAYLAFGATHEHKVHGVLRSFESVVEQEHTAGQYRAILVPRMWHLSQTIESTIYQEKNAVDILLEILRHHGMSEEGEDFEVRIPEWQDKPNQFYRKYPKREYIVQYKESELNFVSRLLENEGIFFFFEQGTEREKLVIADANAAFRTSPGIETIHYRVTAGATVTSEHVSDLRRRKQIVPRKMHVRDFNYRTPNVNVRADHPIDTEMGNGEVFIYGEHVKTVAEGKRYAKIRAEETRLLREQFVGTSVVRGLRPGMRFTLEGHPNPEMDIEYTVISVKPQVDQSPESGAHADPAHPRTPFKSDFVAIRYSDDLPYRPPRIALKPRVVGVMHARVDQLHGATDDVLAPIDEQGRYKVIVPFNNEDGGVGLASRWVRLAEPYVGVQHGMHFPLHVGTEILLVHIDGDPDRPVIMGAVPNAETGNVVTNEDATRSRIVTRSNIRMVWRDRTRSESSGGGGE